MLGRRCVTLIAGQKSGWIVVSREERVEEMSKSTEADARLFLCEWGRGELAAEREKLLRGKRSLWTAASVGDVGGGATWTRMTEVGGAGSWRSGGKTGSSSTFVLVRRGRGTKRKGRAKKGRRR